MNENANVAVLAPACCSNPYCRGGWVPYEPNESRAAPPIACRACQRAMAERTTDGKGEDEHP